MEFSPQYAISQLAPLFKPASEGGMPCPTHIPEGSHPSAGTPYSIIYFEDVRDRPFSFQIAARNNREAECIFALMNGFTDEYTPPEGTGITDPVPHHHGNLHNNRSGGWLWPTTQQITPWDRDLIVSQMDHLYRHLCNKIQRALEAQNEHTPEDQQCLADDMVEAYENRMLTYRLRYSHRDWSIR